MIEWITNVWNRLCGDRQDKIKESKNDGRVETPNYKKEKSPKNIIKSNNINKEEKPNIIVKKGIPNYGNTCYLNSVLQIFASTPELSKYLKNPNCKLSNALLSIMSIVNSNSNANFKSEINCLLNLICQTYPNFTIGNQNDCKEIFTIIIDIIAENNENLEKLFFIKKYITIKCKKGHSQNIEEVSTFFVIPRKYDLNIKKCIGQTDASNGDNKFYCNACKNLIDAEASADYKLPQIVVLYFSGENPKRRNIKENDKFKGKKYKIYGVICFNPSNHHYIAFTLDYGIWREYNDEHVFERKPDYNHVYMAFYRIVK